MRVKYSTAQVSPTARKRYWDEAVSRTYFPLELGFRNTPSITNKTMMGIAATIAESPRLPAIGS